MLSFKSSPLLASIAAAIFGGSETSTGVGTPAGRWVGLQHRGQPPARGILGGPATPGGTRVRSQTRVNASAPPNFDAQIAREAKQARGRAARRRAAGN
ncbi:MAG: hypothetical protein AB9M53_00750 [Leptothrix sp. (in: b-proteobacteria)]